MLSRSLAAFLANAAPQAALWFDSGQPEALVNLADQALVDGQCGSIKRRASDRKTQPGEDGRSGGHRVSQKIGKYFENLAHAFSRFETVGRNMSVSRPVAPDNERRCGGGRKPPWRSAPLNARALRILGQLAEADSDDQEAAKYMRAADQISLHENYASYWLMRKSADEHDYKSAIYYADVLLRTNPQSSSYVVPVVGANQRRQSRRAVGQGGSRRQPTVAKSIPFGAAAECDGPAHTA